MKSVAGFSHKEKFMNAFFLVPTAPSFHLQSNANKLTAEENRKSDRLIHWVDFGLFFGKGSEILLASCLEMFRVRIGQLLKSTITFLANQIEKMSTTTKKSTQNQLNEEA